MFSGMTLLPVPATFLRSEKPPHMVVHAPNCRSSSSQGWQTAIAPDSRILILKVVSICEAEYLLLNGADLVSMSYMIVGRDLGQIRGLFRNAFEHLSLGGVLAVGCGELRSEITPWHARRQTTGLLRTYPAYWRWLRTVVEINYLSAVRAHVTGKVVIFSDYSKSILAQARSYCFHLDIRLECNRFSRG